MIYRAFLIFLFLVVAFKVYSEDNIYRVDIVGNKIVSNATIISKIKIRAGQPYNKNVVNEDVKNLYAMGFFETVEVEKKDIAEGAVIIFKVKEKPVLKDIVIEGAKFIRKKKIFESIDIKKGAFVDEYKMEEAARKIKDLYDKKGFSRTEISYSLTPLADQNEVEARFIIIEKKILKVRGIKIKGNEAVSTRKLLRLIKTRKAWLLNKGIFREDVLDDDIIRIIDFYQFQGFSDVEIDVDTDYKVKGVYVSIYIAEGKRYYIGEIEIAGNKVVSSRELTKRMRLNPGSIFTEQSIYEDSSRIRELYIDKGYIFSQVEPFSLLDPETEKINLTYKVTENEVAYIESIDIRGNTKTKDKVIRRELKIYPGDRFDGKKVRKSKEKLENLGFFEEIRFGTEPASEINDIDLVVEVKEAKTGYFSFGGGYSSIDQLIGFAEVRQRNFDYKNFSNFTGAGQDLSLMFSMGTLTDNYQLSFTNPWIFDVPVSFGFDGYKKGHKRESDVGYAYDQEVEGGALRLGREFNDSLSGKLTYRLEKVDISDVVDEASQDLKDEQGINDLSSGELSLSYDSRDNVFFPLRGIYLLNTAQVTGGIFGGDKDFVKCFSRLSFYLPVWERSVVELKLRSGFADPFSATAKIPIYERFFAGGSSTIRGYRERKVGPIEISGDPIGGEALFVGNLEYTYPLSDFFKVASFYDMGNVWSKNSDFLSGGFRSSVGLGLRVKTPIGPISVDYGWPLDLEPGEDKKNGRFHFSVSRGF